MRVPTVLHSLFLAGTTLNASGDFNHVNLDPQDGVAQDNLTAMKSHEDDNEGIPTSDVF